MNARRAGFSLVEVLIAAGLSALAMTALLSCFVFLARNFVRLAHAQTLDQQARQALARFEADLSLARAIKPGATLSAQTLTLTLPAGEVSYTYEPVEQRLRRQSTFGASTDLVVLGGSSARCTAFAFDYYSGAWGSAENQLVPAQVVARSVKHVRLAFRLETAASQANEVRMTREVVSARYPLRLREPANGAD